MSMNLLGYFSTLTRRPARRRSSIVPRRAKQYATGVRSLRLVMLLAVSASLGCSDEPPGGIEISVERAQLDVNSAAPDAIAELDVTVELQTRGQAEDVTLVRTTITEQPVSDASETREFAARLVNPQGDDPVVRLAAGETIVVRVLNDATLNADLVPLCTRPVELAVVLGTADDEEAMATANISVRCP